MPETRKVMVLRKKKKVEEEDRRKEQQNNIRTENNIRISHIAAEQYIINKH